MNKDLIIQPLGGVGEIGSNCTLFETPKAKIFVDYGILFPYEEFFNISYLAVNLENVEDDGKEIHIIITHGHEDHIGAIFLLLTKFPNSKLYAPKFASLLIRKKLSERGIPARIELFDTETKIEIDNHTVHPIHVTHSIPDTYGLLFQDNKLYNSTLFISDFKFDLKPLYEKPFDFEKIKELFSKTKNNISLLDSTNILNPGRTLSESELVDDLKGIMTTDKRIFITLFSSNIYRIRTINNIAKDLGKKIVLVGRSIKHYISCAEECNLIDTDNIIEDEKSIKNYNNNYIYILTGCQGDHFGALRRVADNEFKGINIDANDLFIFSSKPIPGNEKKINRIYNKITEKGAEIITSRDFNVHASGHPSQKDLEDLYSKINPKLVIPIHGESYFLRKHKEFCERLGIDSQTFGNFSQLVVHEDTLKFFDNDVDDPVIYHSKDLELDRPAISKRRKIAINGACFISLSKKDRDLEITTLGLPAWFSNKEIQIYKLTKGQLSKKLMTKDDEDIAEEIRVFVRNLINNFLGYKPICVVQVLK